MGTDKGVQAAKQLGADKRISMWKSDSQVGMVVLKPPPIPRIDHEVPLIEVAWIETKAQKRQAQERYKEKEELVALMPVAEPRPQSDREDEDLSDRRARRERH